MDVILHIGAHRTGSTSFQAYMRSNSAQLTQMSLGYWGPHRARAGLFHGILPNPDLGIGQAAFQRAQGRINLGIARSQARGVTRLLVSDENILGTMRHNIRSASLYPAAGERVARFIAAFGGQVHRIGVQIRGLDSYWPSACSFCIPRGLPVPKAGRMRRLGAQQRNWRDVITDIAAAAPQVTIYVTTFEQCAARPDLVLGGWTGQDMPAQPGLIWRNRRPDLNALLTLPLARAERDQLRSSCQGDTWTPFSPAQSAALRERYSDDLFWLRAGADGLAIFLEDTKATQTGITSHTGFAIKGQRYDTARRLARPG